MDNTLITIISSSVVVVGSIAFAVSKIQDSIKEINNNINKSILDNSNNIKILSEKLDSFKLLNDTLIEDSISKIDKLINSKNDQLNNIINEYKEKIVANNDKIKIAIIDELKLLDSNISSNIIDVKKDTQSFNLSFEKYHIDNKNKLENNFQNIVKIINNLRLDNLINVSNEIGKYKNGIIEDEYFLQEVGSCKVIKFTDKQSNEITEVYYNEDGSKSYTQTFLEDNLKYETKYLNGILSHGVEYNDNNQVIFAYEYDEAGEVSTKIEYIYDKNGNQTEKSKIDYTRSK